MTLDRLQGDGLHVPAVGDDGIAGRALWECCARPAGLAPP